VGRTDISAAAITSGPGAADRTSVQIRVTIGGRRPAAWLAAACLLPLLAGCGSTDSSGEASGPGSFIGRASNAALFIQWTRASGSVTGSLREEITKRGGRGLSTGEGKSFSGVVNGKGISLQVAGGETLVGQFTGSAFSLSLPGNGGGLTTVEFSPGGVNEYNEAVHQLAVSEYESPCTLYVTGHDAKIEFTGPEAPAQCAHLVQRLPEAGWTTEAQSEATRELACSLTNASHEQAHVTDTGGLTYGTQACKALSGEGWG
jgi:hypothetical protein